MEFTVIYADKPMVEMYILEDKKEVNTNRLISDSIEQPFGGGELDLERVYCFLKSRCCEDGRVDLREILAQAGISNSSLWERVRVTHDAT